MASFEIQRQIKSMGALNGSDHHAALAFEETAAVLDLEPWLVQRFRHPVEESTAYLQILRDSGETVCVPFHVVHHSEMSGCAVGSLSLAPGLQLRDCQVVAMERTWQSALVGLPYGGASFGLVCDPAELSERELIGLARPLARQLRRQSGEAVLLPGRGCCREFIGRLFAETRDSHNVRLSGKPAELAGLDPAHFASEGIAALISEALRQAGKPCIGARVAIQGYEALGQAVSQRLAREGMKVVALSDHSGGIYRPDGLILEDISTRFAREQMLFGYAEAERIGRAELMQVSADVLVLTSGSNQLRESAGDRVAANLVIEADWNAVNEEATEGLPNRGVTIVPWFLATCGTLIAAHWEACNVQILSRPEELLARAYGIVGRAVEPILRYAVENDCTCEQAAYRIAIELAANYQRSCGSET
jgi:glutamate dehydrogenase (NAD(P)+)